MNLRKKYGNLYPGFMLMSGAQISLTKEAGDAAMAVIKKRYNHEALRLQLNIDLETFGKDLKKEDVQMKPTPQPVKQRQSRGVGEKLLSIWKGKDL